MVEVNKVKIEVLLHRGEQESKDQVKIVFSGLPCSELSLTPEQARTLASQLIDSVHKAEVRSKLRQGGGKQSTNKTASGLVSTGKKPLVPAHHG